MSVRSMSMLKIVLVACLSIWLTGCDSDLETEPGPTPTPPPESGEPGEGSSNDAFSLQIDSSSVNMVEGAGSVAVGLSIARLTQDSRPITLVARGAGSSDEQNMTWEFTDTILSNSETSSSLVLRLAIGSRPIMPQSRTFVVTATDGASQPLSSEVVIQVQPTPRPDVYLVIGQSNMVGSSEAGAKQAGPGQEDAPNDRIRQLNVTGNDSQNFEVAADFTNPGNIFNTGLPLTLAVDPLHDGFNSNINGKSGELIGPGLSFAKRALVDTTAVIYLVPAAWSDTGFCKRDTNRVEGIGWNATAKTNQALSGTLLHDRAIARTNVALAETGGILRGILWHQGEADSDDPACAQSYAANLTELVISLRSNIDVDARGAVARGTGSDVPFIAATMSMGNDSNGDLAPFDSVKQLVDDAHRNIGNVVPVTDFVNNDDLVPPAFPCGDGSCIHFGSEAYREMGRRYYERLISLLP